MTTKTMAKNTFVKANGGIGSWTTEEVPALQATLLDSLRVTPQEDRILLVHTATWVDDYDAKWGEWDHSRTVHNSVLTLLLVGDRNKKVRIQLNGGTPVHDGYLCPGQILWHAINWNDDLETNAVISVTIDGTVSVLNMAGPANQERDTTKVWTAAQLA